VLGTSTLSRRPTGRRLPSLVQRPVSVVPGATMRDDAISRSPRRFVAILYRSWMFRDEPPNLALQGYLALRVHDITNIAGRTLLRPVPAMRCGTVVPLVRCNRTQIERCIVTVGGLAFRSEARTLLDAFLAQPGVDQPHRLRCQPLQFASMTPRADAPAPPRTWSTSRSSAKSRPRPAKATRRGPRNTLYN